jgi:poly(hydroxyalkanoate) granule-associated protein
LKEYVVNNDTEKQAPESVAHQLRAAVDKAQEEAGKVVDSLVKEGGKLRDQTLKLAGEKVDEVRERVDEVRGMVEGVKTRAADTLDNLEQLFEERVARALKRLGVPSRDDLQGIARRMEEMNSQIQGLAEDRRAAGLAAPPAEKDNLKLISGIGPVLEGKLNGAGITTYQQIAALTDEEIERLELEVIHFSGRVHRDDWIGQAKTLYLKKHGKTI